MPWLLLCALAQAATVPGDYPTLVDAVLAAAPGARIDLGPGTWSGSIVVDRAIDIVAIDPSSTTILPTPGLAAVTVTGSGALTLRGVTLDGAGDSGIRVDTGGTLLFEDSVCRNAVAPAGEDGGCVSALDGATVTIRRARFEDNGDGAQIGGHLYANGATVEIHDSVFRRGHATNGGAISALYSDVAITGSRFADNVAGAAGAVNAQAGSVLIADSWFYDNVADQNGGVVLEFNDGVTLRDNLFVRNVASDRATALDLRENTGTVMEDCVFLGNIGGAAPLTTDAVAAILNREHGAVIARCWFEGNLGAGQLVQTTFTDDLSFVDNVLVRNDQGVLHLYGARGAFLRNRWCGNRGLAGVELVSSDDTRIENNQFVDLERDGTTLYSTTPAAIYAHKSLTTVAHNDIVGVVAPSGDGSGIVADDDTVTATGNVVAFAQGYGAANLDAGASTHDWGLFWGNGTDALGAVVTNATFADPAYLAYAPGADCEDHRLRPALGSPLVDAADPSGAPDRDGTRADIGAWGGPGGDLRWDDDADGDGFPARVDCHDGDADLHPGAAWFLDADGDGVGGPTRLDGCVPPDIAYVRDGSDCDDGDPRLAALQTVYPDGDGDGLGATAGGFASCEVPSGHVLEPGDCDDGDASLGLEQRVYDDADADGYGDPATERLACGVPTGAVSDASDCDDADATRNPDTVWYADTDQDGLGDPAVTEVGCAVVGDWVQTAGDCDDRTAAVGEPASWWADADGDGYGDPDDVPVTACEAPDGAVDNAADCDDADPAAYPGAPGWAADCAPVPSDTGTPPDTDAPTDPGGTTDPGETAEPGDPDAGVAGGGDAADAQTGGCGCDSRGATPVYAVWLLVGALVLRRRHPPRHRRDPGSAVRSPTP